MLNEVDQAPEKANTSSDANTAMANFVQDLYSSAVQDVTKAASAIASTFKLNDLVIDFGADAAKGSSHPPHAEQAKPNSESSKPSPDDRTSREKGQSGERRKLDTLPETENHRELPDGKETSRPEGANVQPNVEKSSGGINSIEGEAKPKGGANSQSSDDLGKSKIEIEKSLLPGVPSNIEGIMNKSGKSAKEADKTDGKETVRPEGANIQPKSESLNKLEKGQSGLPEHKGDSKQAYPETERLLVPRK